MWQANFPSMNGMVKKPQLMVTDFAVSGRQLFDFRGKIIKRNQFLQKQQLIFCLMKKSKFISDPTANIIVWSNQEELVEAVSQNQIEQLVLSTVLWKQSRLKKLLKQLRYNVYT